MKKFLVGFIHADGAAEDKGNVYVPAGWDEHSAHGIYIFKYNHAKSASAHVMIKVRVINTCRLVSLSKVFYSWVMS